MSEVARPTTAYSLDEAVEVVEVDLDLRLPDLAAQDPPVTILVLAWRRPAGLLEVDASSGVSAAALADLIWSELGGAVRKVLATSQPSSIPVLSSAGYGHLPSPSWALRTKHLAKSGPPASVIIPTRDRPAMLETSLRSAVALRYHAYELVVVDNASRSADTRRVVEKMAAESRVPVRYLRELRPGISWARNCGIEAARHPIIAFTDDDTIQDPDWLANLVAPFVDDPLVGCVTGQALPARTGSDEHRWREARAGAQKFGFDRRVFDLSSASGSAFHPFSTGVMGMGMNMAMRSSVLREIGRFDVGLGVGTRTGGGEDLAAFFEVMFRGHRIVFEPSAFLYHVHRETYDDLRKQMRSWGIGFSAYLTSILVRHPTVVPKFVGRVLVGARAARSSASSSIGPTLPEDYPAELVAIERRAYALGPLAYVRSRRAARRSRGTT